MELHLKKSPRSRSEILFYFDDCKLETLKEACIIGREGSYVDVPKANEDCSDYGVVITSTPNPKETNVARRILNTEDEGSLLNQKNVPNTKSNAVSVSKILSMVERKLKEDAILKQKSVLLAREEQSQQETAAYQAQLVAQSHAKDLKFQEEQLQFLKEEETLAAQRKQRQELQQQRHAQRASMRDEQIKVAELQKKEADAELRKKRAAEARCTEEVFSCVTQFSEVFQKLKSELGSDQTLSHLAAEAKPLNLSMQKLIKQLNTTNANQNDVDFAKSLCTKINAIFSNVLVEVAKLKKQAEEKAAIRNNQSSLVQPQVTKPQDAKTVTAEVFNEPSTVDGLSDCSDKESLQWYQELRTLKQSNEMLFEQLLTDDSLKKYRFDCQKAINIPVNAISPVSAHHLRDKLQKLALLLSGQSVMVGDGVRVVATQHPAGIPFCKDLLAKKFVRQGASTVSSKPEAAFAIAAVIVALWQEFPDWGQLLLAHFHQECPYLVPVFWPQLEGQSNKEYYQSLGYIYNEDGEVEKQDKFLKRMSGIMRLYTAVIITPLPRDKQNRPHPHGLGQGWRWLTSLLNLEPRPDICASLLYDFLEVAGSSMSEQYGKQYKKLLHAIIKGYLPRLQRIADSSGGPVVRLETYLQTILRQESKPPQGMLPSNFW